MAEPSSNYNADEREILRRSRLMKELLDHPAWKEYVAIQEAQIKTREIIIRTPLSDLPEALRSLDFMSRAAAMESIKGAIIGLTLARDTPQSIIAHAKEIVREHSDTTEDSNA